MSRSQDRVQQVEADLVRRARAHLTAAFAILESPTAEPEHAIVHLLRVWRVLACVGEHEPPKTDEDLMAAVCDHRLAALPAARSPKVARFVQFLLDVDRAQAWEISSPPSRRRLQAHARQLARTMRQLETSQVLNPWRQRLAALGALGVVIVGLAFLAWRQGIEKPPWQAAYFPASDFQGKPVYRNEKVIDFDWQEEPPLPGFPHNHFSVRWESCLTLEERSTVAFQLSSDDGSELYIDRTLIVDNGGLHSRRSRGLKVTLVPGIHHLQVDYIEGTGTASVTLSASLDGELPQPLRTSLRAPSRPGAPHISCER